MFIYSWYNMHRCVQREIFAFKRQTDWCILPRHCCQDSPCSRHSGSSMTDTKVKYMKLELIYTSHLHIQTVLEHGMFAVDLTLLSTHTTTFVTGADTDLLPQFLTFRLKHIFMKLHNVKPTKHYSVILICLIYGVLQ